MRGAGAPAGEVSPARPRLLSHGRRGVTALLLRMAAELYLVAMVVRDLWDPRRDPVRASLVPQAVTTRSKVVAV